MQKQERDIFKTLWDLIQQTLLSIPSRPQFFFSFLIWSTQATGQSNDMEIGGTHITGQSNEKTTKAN